MSSEPIAAFRNAELGYGPATALRVPALEWRAGEAIGVIGRTGAGKSTLLRAVLGLGVSIKGDLRRGRALSERAASGYVSQRDALIPWRTVEGNVRWALKGQMAQRRADVAGMIGRVGLAGAERKYPDQLSGGMARRVMLAKALIFEPRFLFLDEAFGSIDPLTKSDLVAMVVAYTARGNAALMMISHDLREIVVACDRVFAIDRANVLQELETYASARGAPLHSGEASEGAKRLFDQFVSEGEPT
jgi:ABC-type nitrate/sulfonate/bicarbonate transport system ATPase subunit